LASAAFFAVVLLGAMAGMWLELWPRQPWFMWVAWLVASYVFFWNGRRIIHKAWGAAWRGITNQHVLLSIGAIGAYIGGLLGTPIAPLGWIGLPAFPAVDFFWCRRFPDRLPSAVRRGFLACPDQGFGQRA
jgi:cation transport ATPase